METFALHQPLDPETQDVTEGFVVVRRSVLRRHWPTARALSREFPGLTEERSDYRDAGPDQARVCGPYDQLVTALADERFAAAVRHLTSALLTAGTVQGAGHSHRLVDEVLGRARPDAEWICLVNDRTEMWGYDQDVPEMFGNLPADGAYDDWHLSSCFHQIRAGDRIWVYASTPHRRIVAAGTAWADPYLRADGDEEPWDMDWSWPVDADGVQRLTSALVGCPDPLQPSCEGAAHRTLREVTERPPPREVPVMIVLTEDGLPQVRPVHDL
ncbi:hypothetical protein [Micromonospora aurantiaca (nom. illeg.)]|uniref:hypothetical protein n=1 Tax=Micromonospora aurantiaca (nom. illeg.) TaxID=47850 RepID=UPI00161745F0